MSSAIHRGTSLQSLSLDEIGVTQVQSASIDSTVDSKVSDSAQDRRKSFRGVKSADTTDNQETVSDVRAWAKEASFKLKSFNYKIPGDKGSLAKGKSADSTNPPITNTTTAGIAMSSNNVKSSITTTTVTSTVEVKVEKPATPPPAPEPEPTSNITSSTTSATNSSVDSLETPPQEPATNDDIGEREKLTVVPEANEAEENADDSTVATIVDQANAKKKRIGPNGEEIDDEEDDANDELNNVKLKPTVQNTFVKEEAAPIFTNVNLKPVPKVIDSKTFNTDKPTTGVYSFLQLKATRFGSRDSLSTLSASHDDDHLSIRSEPLPPRKPREHVLTPYEHLKKINKTKVYGDYAPEELERYLSDEEFQKVLGKNRSEFYTLPLWKQHFLKKRAQIF